MVRQIKKLWVGLVFVLVSCGDNTPPATLSTEDLLTGSTFESGDGNLVSNGGTDWTASPPALATKNDKATGSTDNAFGQGTKEDAPTVSVVTGSIPPNKNDLTRFYVAHENAGGQFFLYLAWERLSNIGAANLDFEFNQASQTLTDASTGTVTVLRTPGDLLVTYDFGGSGAPVLGLLRWLTAGHGDAVADCFSSNTLPCWGKRTDLSSAGIADGAVNTGTVTDAVENPALTLGVGLFGEAGINLSAANVFPAGQCVNFASAFVKSRSSSSFTAEVKDFIAPTTANISNCGSIGVHKTDGTAALAGAGFTLYTGTPSDKTCSGSVVATCTTDSGGNCSFGGSIPFGTYCIAETSTPPLFFTAPAQAVSISQVSPSATVPFVDNRQPGALLITKLQSNGSALAGATFSVTDATNTVVATGTSNAQGQMCVTGLTIGATYTVTETAPPPNYSGSGSKPVMITAYSPDCVLAPATVTFTDAPLSDISCTFTSDAGAGITAANIQCTGEANSTSFTTHNLIGLVPGTYSCTFAITAQ